MAGASPDRADAGGVAMFYDVGQAKGGSACRQNGSPHLPASIASGLATRVVIGRGNTLVIDVTNFSPKTDVQGFTREFAFGGALDTDRCLDARICRHDRRSDGVDTVMDRQARVHQTERRAEQDLLRTSLASKSNYGSQIDECGARRRPRLCPRKRPQPATKDNARDFVGVEQDRFQ